VSQLSAHEPVRCTECRFEDFRPYCVSEKARFPLAMSAMGGGELCISIQAVALRLSGAALPPRGHFLLPPLIGLTLLPDRVGNW
jgi:hypothetical protein